MKKIRHMSKILDILWLAAQLFSVIMFVRNYNENIAGLAGDLVQ